MKLHRVDSICPSDLCRRRVEPSFSSVAAEGGSGKNLVPLIAVSVGNYRLFLPQELLVKEDSREKSNLQLG